MAQPPPPPPPPPSGNKSDGKSGSSTPWPRWSLWVLVGVILASFLLTTLVGGDDGESMSYEAFMQKAGEGEVASMTFDNTNAKITGKLDDGTEFTTTGPLQSGLPPEDLATLRANDVEIEYDTPSPNPLWSLLSFALPIILIIGFFWWMSRRAQGQMGGIMSIGRSRAKTYSTERPGTTFADVAGYDGVKQEITEVVDFLKHPERFRDIGARIPKGILLVGPPGTGKTLIARAVAGEAGVPFLSVSGSDFMEMFVGVGASRVRDLFQSARKMGRAIIFVDEI
ncbi:MAG TPA: ATP-dependent metallopeptidase FtsH/Yme1/Tma family protein, partial [Acidimicrobiales bacterium]